MLHPTACEEYSIFHNEVSNNSITCYHRSLEELEVIVAQNRRRKHPINRRLHRDEATTDSSEPTRPCHESRRTPTQFWGTIGNLSDSELPWRCPREDTTLMTGVGLFPASVPTVNCNSCTCMFGKYRCMAVYRRVRVLILNSCKAVQHFNQETFIEQWRFKEIEVTADCECRQRIL